MARKLPAVVIAVLLVGVVCSGPVHSAPARDLTTIQLGAIPVPILQWFVPITWTGNAQRPYEISGEPVANSKEFYDNVAPNLPVIGWPWGGSATWKAIQGVVVSISRNMLGEITGFKILAQVSNDLYDFDGRLRDTAGSNDHGQSAPDIVNQKKENMYNVRLTAEFADDAIRGNLPVGVAPFGQESNIYAMEYDSLAWFCYSAVEPPPVGAFPGDYWVPTWSFVGPKVRDLKGTPNVIEVGDVHSRELQFGCYVPLKLGEYLYALLEDSMRNQTDIFLNRTRSLKVSDYPDTPVKDNGDISPEIASDVSVFYTPEGLVEMKDWGDAPDAVGSVGYPTLAVNNGANHLIVPGFCLGSAIDPEPDGQPNATATGDDNDPDGDDEDGVVATTQVIPGYPASVVISATAKGILQGWLDFNRNNSWADAGEQVFTDVGLNPGLNTLTFNVPASALVGQTFGRLRFSSVRGLGFAGPAPDGEVEDYKVDIGEPKPEYDLGDAPDSSNSWAVQMTAYPAGGPSGTVANFPTVFSIGSPPYGPLHRNPRVVAYLGGSVSLELEADIGPDQDGLNNLDPRANIPDKDTRDDGVVMPLKLENCTPSGFKYTVTVVDPQVDALYVNVWFDWNRDGDWDDIMQCSTGGVAPEWAVQNQQLGFGAPGVYTVTTPQFLPWHPSGPVGPIWMRITLAERPWQSLGTPGSGGSGPIDGYNFGETEDYYFTPIVAERRDWGDAPDAAGSVGYPTLAVNNGANHLISPNVFLGSAIDQDADGQPDANALGDDNDPDGDDEDGVTFLTPIIPGATARINVVASTSGKLDAWLDFGRDNSWAEPEDRIAASVPLVPGDNLILVPVPVQARAGVSFARFRFSTAGGLGFAGPASDGEVEDYQVTIQRRPVIVTKGKAKNLPVGTLVLILDDVVTANFGREGWFFEEPDRSSGIGVLPPADLPASPWAINDVVSCYGVTELVGCELMIREMSSWKTDELRIRPVGQNNRTSGGEAFGNQPGLIDVASSFIPGKLAYGLNSVGMLVTLWGRCTYIEPGFPGNFWIDDGSSLWDGTVKPTGAPAKGVRVRIPPNLPTPIREGAYYVVTGIMRATPGQAGSMCVRWLWPRVPGDIVAYLPME